MVSLVEDLKLALDSTAQVPTSLSFSHQFTPGGCIADG
jgi:hypothetical protein